MSETAAVQVPCPWHAPWFERVEQQRQQQRLPHALLISGPAGIGKLRLARAIAEALLCVTPAGGMACGQCRGCHLSVAGSHPDLVEITPQDTSRVIKVDQVRALVDFCAHTAQYAGYRIVLVHPAEAMNQASANALLKTLEEPGEQTLLILVSHNASRLLPTVRSRCQQWSLPVPDHQLALDWLAPRVGGDEQARELLGAAAGAPLRALGLQDEPWFADRTDLLNALGLWATGKRGLVESAASFKSHDPEIMLQQLWTWAGQVARSASGQALRNPDPTVEGHLKALGQRVPLANWLRFADRAQQLQQAFAAGANPQKELVFEQLLLELKAGQD